VRVLITGITGQDGSYLAELLLAQGHEVFGVRRRSSSFNTGRIDHIYKDSHLNESGLRLVHGDMSDASSLHRVIYQLEPDRVYNLAAQSHVGVSFDEPEYTADTVALGALRLLEVIRNIGDKSAIRLYQASTSELFGGQDKEPLTENSLFNPRSPYAAAKMYAHTLTRNYRNAFDIFCSTGILFNHESPRRGQTFVTRKITMGIARHLQGSEMPIYLGNLDSVRDWGHAKDYVEAMTLILEAEKADDYIVATGTGHTVREFLILACNIAGLEVASEGSGSSEVLLNKKTNKVIAMVDPRYFRPLEVDQLIGDATKIKESLGWRPRITFEELVSEMVQHDIKLLSK
jgi:GDPmannose 4,6-dehydratase